MLTERLVDLQRSFEPDVAEDDSTVYNPLLKGGFEDRGLSWADVLKHPVSLITGQAGSGKTSELRLQHRVLTDAGTTAFYLRLEGIVTAGVEGELGSRSRDFHAWIRGDGPAVFLLDSVDEAQVAKRDAAPRALQSLLDAMSEARIRATLVVSSRPTFLGSSTAFEGVLAAIATHQAATMAEQVRRASLGGEANVRLRRRRRKESSEAISTFLRLKLKALTPAQAALLARHFGVSDSDALVKRADARGVNFLLERPVTVRWVCEYWQKHEDIGSLSDCIDGAVRDQLKEFNPVHEERQPAYDALRATCTLAAASLLTTDIGIAVPRAGYGAAGTGIDALQVLPEWGNVAVQQLLSRGVFEQAGADRVRFQELLVRDYLAARWFLGLLTAGAPIALIRPLFLPMVDGQRIPVPELVSVLGWLSNWDERVQDDVLRLAPQVGIFFGDFATYPPEIQDRAIRRFLSLVRDGLELDWYIAESDFARIARPHLADSLSSFLDAEPRNEELERLILRLVTAGCLTACQPAVRRGFDRYSNSARLQWHAAAALAKVGAPEDIEALRALVLTGNPAGVRVVLEICEALFPSNLTVDELFDALRRCPTWTEPGGDPIEYLLEGTILPLLNAAQLTDTLRRANEWAESLGPLSPGPGRKLEEPSLWVQEFLGRCLAALLNGSREDQFDEGLAASAVRRLELVAEKFHEHPEGSEKVREALVRHPQFRRMLLSEILQNSSHPHLPWALQPGAARLLVEVTGADVSWLEKMLATSENAATRGFCWELVIGLWLDKKTMAAWRAVLHGIAREKAVKRTWYVATGMVIPLRRRTRQLGWELRKRWRLIRDSVRSKQHRWQLRHRLRGITQGVDVGALNFLASAMQEAEPRSHYSLSNWYTIANEFGPNVEAASRRGFVAAWRRFEPPFPPRPNGGVDLRVRIGLIGLAAELNGDTVADLDEAEVQLALRYALNELNGYPPWMDALASRWPELVAKMVMQALELELASASGVNPHIRSLQDLAHSGICVRDVVAPQLWFLVQSDGMPGAQALSYAMNVIYGAQTLDSQALVDECSARCTRDFASASWTSLATWLSAWLFRSPTEAWNWYEEAVRGSCIVPHPSAELLGEALRDWSFLGKESAAFPVQILERMVVFFHEHVSPTNDLVHRGAYSPTTRDHAQQFRYRLPSYIATMRGPAARSALQRLVGIPSLSMIRDRLQRLIVEHEQRSVSLTPWKLGDIATFAMEHSPRPTTSRDLFRVTLARLEDVRYDVELGDFSNRDLLNHDASIAETAVQKWLASRLRLASNGQYSVVREDEVDRRKKPDIRILCGDSRVGIEIKPLSVGRYSYNELVDTLRLQLAGQYLRDMNSRHGVLVLFLLERRRWRLDGGRLIEFPELLSLLALEATQIKESRDDVEGLEVFGIDCAPPSEGET